MAREQIGAWGALSFSLTGRNVSMGSEKGVFTVCKLVFFAMTVAVLCAVRYLGKGGVSTCFSCILAWKKDQKKT